MNTIRTGAGNLSMALETTPMRDMISCVDRPNKSPMLHFSTPVSDALIEQESVSPAKSGYR
jgi:hypothetical protein